MPEIEQKLIERIRRAAHSGPSVVVGIGDDAAVMRLAPGHEILVTTDFSIEKIHFRREWHPAAVVGWRCLTRGLSDIAAMGGEPQAVFLSLALARDVPQKWVSGFMKGLLDLAKQFHVPLAGGDTAETVSGIQADIVVVGSVPRGTAVLRSGAKPGDHIYVTGELGGSAATLARLRNSQPTGSAYSAYLKRIPRLVVGQWLRQNRVPTAMIDLSDGLSTDLQHICKASRVGARIQADSIPRVRFGKGKRPVDLKFALHGGDDYELLFTSSRNVPTTVAGVRITRIGLTTAETGMRVVDADGKSRSLAARGWEHFRAT